MFCSLSAVTHLQRQRNHGVARNARQHGSGKRRRIDFAVADDEDIFAAAFAHMAAGIERDALGIAVGDRFHLDELGVHIVGRSLGHGRQGVGRNPLPGGNAHIHAVAQRFVAQVFPPRPRQDVNLNGILQGIDTHFTFAAKRHRAEVAVLDVVDAHQFHHRLRQLLARVGQLHAIDLGGVHQAVGVLLQPEDRRAVRRVVAPNAFKQGGGIVKRVRRNVDRGLRPGNEFAVVPNMFVVSSLP